MFALGSLAEPFSIAILEALATGLPVVHHRYETTIWVAGRCGIPVAMDVPGRAADALMYLRDDAAAWGRTSAAGRELAETRYAPDVVARELVRELERVFHGT